MQNQNITITQQGNQTLLKRDGNTLFEVVVQNDTERALTLTHVGDPMCPARVSVFGSKPVMSEQGLQTFTVPSDGAPFERREADMLFDALEVDSDLLEPAKNWLYARA